MLDLGAGRGATLQEMSLCGVDPDNTYQEVEEALRMIGAMWQGDDFEWHGDLLEVQAPPDRDRHVILPRPVQLPHPPLYLACTKRDTVTLAAERHGLSERTLQRLFRRYVGVGPKWVLQRARLHDAVERLDTADGPVDLAALATELGWFDQAHFTRDFTALVGQSPAAYAARR